MAIEHTAAAGPSLLQAAFVYLAAAVITVPVAKRLGLGSVLGYLIAGVVIGPFGLRLVASPEQAEDIMHTAEFGVVIMLFLIGMELQPSRLWAMRDKIVGMGGSQMLLTGLSVGAIALAFGLSWQMALAAGFTLALSSTAIVLQSLRERGIAQTDAGRNTFSVLLFQDIALIPMLALFPLLATLPMSGAAAQTGPIDALPPWAQAVAVLAAVALIIGLGRYALRPIMRWIAATDMHEVFTAFALALVVGVALLMQAVGLSPALGAFVAGVVLANSEFRHEIETDIAPFHGLLLGLFFLSVGASIDFALVMENPLLILGLAVGLIVVKAAVMFAVAVAFKMDRCGKLLIALGLAQGGEFAFVLFAFAQQGGIISAEVAKPLIVVVALSMAATPLLIGLAVWLGGRLMKQPEKAAERPHEIEDGHPEVIIAGYGRFGQIVGRMMQAKGTAVSVIEHDAEQVEVLRGFGRKVNYGDASRMDLLRIAGAAEAKLLVIAIDDQDKALELAKEAREHFPNLKIAARAYDRRRAYEFMKLGVDALERETFMGGVRLAKKSLKLLGVSEEKASLVAEAFIATDERVMEEVYEASLTMEFAEYQRIIRDRTALEAETIRQEMKERDRIRRGLPREEDLVVGNDDTAPEAGREAG
jgi:glutathione-regulated potassium-efflux system ancillary protein KefC